MPESYLVLGLGQTGSAAAFALAQRGDRVAVWDDQVDVRGRFMAEVMRRKAVQKTKEGERERGNAAETFPYLFEGADRWRGPALEDAARDGLVISPGIPHLYPRPHPCAEAAREVGIPLLSDLDIWLETLPEDVTAIGVTGTNGKSTTTELIGFVAQAAGHPSFVAGNMGVSPFSHTHPERNSVCVLEISSFQLDLMRSRRLNCAVLLNIGMDHLERHGGLEGYFNSKISILNRVVEGGSAIIGVDDTLLQGAYQHACSERSLKIIPISGSQRVSGGVYAQDGQLVSELDSATPQMVTDLRTFPRLLGSHNHQNIAAALAATTATNLCHAKDFVEMAPGFQGLRHRQECVAEYRGCNGVSYQFINDSKATNLEAACRALSSFKNIHWIVGGREKENADLSSLESCLDNVRSIWLIGEASQGALGTWLQAYGHRRTASGRALKISLSQTLDCAVREAADYAAVAPEGEVRGLEDESLGKSAREAVILLAPACASFDAFKNFEDRGNAFRDHARAMASLMGNPAAPESLKTPESLDRERPPLEGEV